MTRKQSQGYKHDFDLIFLFRICIDIFVCIYEQLIRILCKTLHHRQILHYFNIKKFQFCLNEQKAVEKSY